MNLTQTNQSHSQKGFTLIELSIVLVIIGLIVGGVLVGQDLIKGAQIRATVSQLEKYSTAVNAFRNKYSGLPGDLVTPTNFFPSVASSSSTTDGRGDGDGLIETSTASNLDGESQVFWYELNQAGLIPEAINTLNMTTAYTINQDTSLPLAKLAKGNRIGVTNAAGLNYFIMGIFGGTTSAATLAAGLTPIDAFQLDSKIDDGIPTSGTVISIAGDVAAPGTAANVSAQNCYATSSSVYATATSPNAVGCAMSFRSSF